MGRTARSFLLSTALVAGIVAATIPAQAQQQDNLNLGVISSSTGRAAGTVTATPTPNTGANGAICTLNLTTSSSGAPSVTFSIQFQDTASATWQSLVTSGAVTAAATPTSIMVYPGAVATSVPSGMVIAGLKLPPTWRVSATFAGTGAPVAQYSIGCALLK